MVLYVLTDVDLLGIKLLIKENNLIKESYTQIRKYSLFIKRIFHKSDNIELDTYLEHI